MTIKLQGNKFIGQLDLLWSQLTWVMVSQSLRHHILIYLNTMKTREYHVQRIWSHKSEPHISESTDESKLEKASGRALVLSDQTCHYVSTLQEKHKLAEFNIIRGQDPKADHGWGWSLVKPCSPKTLCQGESKPLLALGLPSVQSSIKVIALLERCVQDLDISSNMLTGSLHTLGSMLFLRNFRCVQLSSMF